MKSLLTLAVLGAAGLAVLPAAVLAPAPAADATSAPASRTAESNVVTTQRATTAKVTIRNPVTTAAAVAERFWGKTPCGGHIKIVADSPVPAGLASGTDGWVTFNSSLGPDRLDAPASTYTDCTISLAHWQWATRTDMESDWGMFCLTMTHEMGHLLGHKHTLRPGSVMNPVFTNESDVPAACNSTWLPGWRYGSQ
jgi:Matrixin